jgi:response regulator of citrate/malate metabolism
MKKVIIIEDEYIMHFIYRQLLKNDSLLQSLEVVSAYNFDEAVTTLTHDDAKAQTSLCVILDLDLGKGHTGWEILNGSYLAEYKSVMVFICSSSSSIKDQEKALDYPQVVGYFQKPIQQNFVKSIGSKFFTI